MNQAIGSPAGVRSVDAGRGLGWWTDAWALLMKNPGMWVPPGLVVGVIFFVAGWIPLGSLALSLVMPVFAASLMLAARKAAMGEAIDITDAFSAFKSDKLPSLLVIGALLLAVSIALKAVLAVIGMGSVAGVVAGAGAGSAGAAMAAAGLGFLTMLVTTLLTFVINLGFWFAPGLVVMRGMAPLDAVKASFAAILKNMAPFIVFAAICFVAAIVASIPARLGWLVLLPFLMVVMFVSYRDIYGD